ncbi:DMT family transporter [Balneatrix alpica]|uniref:DMT family transporter n=1 Tax=Balneatrix alpica TaxID=75684 RepID=UPI00273A4DDE|nr:DMT family transporter [Balneatrix alpica]
MDSRKPLDSLAIGLMIPFCICFGLQQVALKAAAPDMAPMLQIALRSILGAAMVYALLRWQKESMTWRNGVWQPGLLVGVLFALEYVFLAEALRYTSAGHAVVFLYTSPMFSALILHFRLETERMSLVQWLGILLAFAGIVTAFGGNLSIDSSEQLFGDFLALLGGLAWGLTTVVIRTSSLSNLPSKQTVLYQLLVAAALLTPLAWWWDQFSFNPTPLLLGSLAFQTLIIAFGALLIWFWLLRNYQASRIGVLSFMTPIFGVLLGAWLLDETIEPGFMLGALLVVAGISLVSGHEWLLGYWRKRQARMLVS